jgi:hypothetical protein
VVAIVDPDHRPADRPAAPDNLDINARGELTAVAAALEALATLASASTKRISSSPLFVSDKVSDRTHQQGLRVPKL